MTNRKHIRIPHHASRITHHAPRITHHASRITHYASRTSLLALLLLAALFLAACERPLRQEPQLPTTTIITPVGEDTIAVPTAQIPSDATPDPLAPTPDPLAQPTADISVPGDQQATPLPPADATPLPPVGDATTIPPTTEQQYTVQAGDTLGEIAQQFGVTAEEIAAHNNLPDVDSISAGQVLIIPVAGSSPPIVADPTTAPGSEQIHIVQAGETLYRIALRYGLTYQELAAYNNLANPDAIEVGQAIRIPPSQ